MSSFQDLGCFSITITLRQRPKGVTRMLLWIKRQRESRRLTLLGCSKRKPLKLEKTTSSVLSVFLLIYVLFKTNNFAKHTLIIWLDKNTNNFLKEHTITYSCCRIAVFININFWFYQTFNQPAWIHRNMETKKSCQLITSLALFPCILVNWKKLVRNQNLCWKVVFIVLLWTPTTAR